MALHHNSRRGANSGDLMFRSLVGGLALAGCTFSGFAETVDAPSNARVLPMTFAMINEGPADACGGAKFRGTVSRQPHAERFPC